MNTYRPLASTCVLTVSLMVCSTALGQSPKSNKQESQRKYIDVPMYFDATGLPHVRAEIEGEPMLMLVDTGSSSSCIDAPSAKRAGLSGGKKVKSISGNSTVEFERVEIKQLKVGAMSSPGRVDIVDYSAINNLHTKKGEPTVDGILGADYLIGRFAVVDYGRKKVRLWTSGEDWQPLGRKSQSDRTVELPVMENKKGVLLVKVKVDGTPMNFEVDTGADSTTIDTASAQRAKLKLQKTDGKSIGVSGAQEVSRTTINDFAVGSIHIKANAFAKSFEAQKALFKSRGDPELDGLLDSDFFRKHDAIIDFGGKRVYLRPEVQEAKDAEND